MCGKRSCYKEKYLVIGVEGFEVGCFWLADPSARLKAFSGGLLKILLVLLSSRRIRKFLEIIFSTTRLLGWKVVTKGTLTLAMSLAASLFKISALDLVYDRSLPLLMRSFGYPRAVKKVSIFAASMSKSASSLQILRSLRNWLEGMDDLQL